MLNIIKVKINFIEMAKFWTVTKDNNRNYVRTALFLINIFVTNLGKYMFSLFKIDFKILDKQFKKVLKNYIYT